MRRLPLAMQKQGALLLQQQCWLWGQDIRRDAGNLLLDYGLHRQRPPQDVQGCSQYTMHLSGGLQLRLWGFGLFYGAEQGVYLNRFTFRPLSASLREPVWSARQLEHLPPSQDFASVAAAALWIAAYEADVLARLGRGYRHLCLSGLKGKALSPEELQHAWRQLSSQLQVIYSQTAPEWRLPKSAQAIRQVRLSSRAG